MRLAHCPPQTARSGNTLANLFSVVHVFLERLFVGVGEMQKRPAIADQSFLFALTMYFRRGVCGGNSNYIHTNVDVNMEKVTHHG